VRPTAASHFILSAPPRLRAQATRAAMVALGLSAAQQAAVLRAVAGVLHLGNTAFAPAEEPLGSPGPPGGPASPAGRQRARHGPRHSAGPADAQHQHHHASGCRVLGWPPQPVAAPPASPGAEGPLGRAVAAAVAPSPELRGGGAEGGRGGAGTCSAQVPAPPAPLAPHALLAPPPQSTRWRRRLGCWACRVRSWHTRSRTASSSRPRVCRRSRAGLTADSKPHSAGVVSDASPQLRAAAVWAAGSAPWLRPPPTSVPVPAAVPPRRASSRPTPAGSIASPLSPAAAADCRDSLARELYARLFEWLVAAVNGAVAEAHAGASGAEAAERAAEGGVARPPRPPPSSTAAAGEFTPPPAPARSVRGGAAPGREGGEAVLSIRLLDIYGFESFEAGPGGRRGRAEGPQGLACVAAPRHLRAGGPADGAAW
jgi:hypothetical protein